MSRTPKEDLLIGAHTSAQGGAYNALLQGQDIGATTIQFFTSNQKRWEGKTIEEKDVDLFKETLKATGMKKIMSHDSYLINLGSPDPEMSRKSRKAFKEEIKRCHTLGVTFLNFHPGAATTGTDVECLDKIVASLEEMQELIHEGHTRILLETTAGQGTSVGHHFDQIGYIVKKLNKKIPIGVCIDTCHIFAAGYDIRTKKGWEETLSEFDKEIGISHLYALHVNDSMKPLGSRKDRHAPLGKGEIGLECFKVMMQHPDLREIPKYLETPDGPPLWVKEIQMLRDFAT
ncbi:MAG: deoxyribonuclease IV [Chlamydiota bacterium]